MIAPYGGIDYGFIYRESKASVSEANAKVMAKLSQ